MKVNQNYRHLNENYLFAEIARRVTAYSKAHPTQEIIRMGIGDVTLPLCPAVVRAMQSAIEEMGVAATFHGYGPEQGYAFLREKIRESYRDRKVCLDMEELFISDGAKSDLGNILDLFEKDNTVLIPDPVYPVYVDTNTMSGRTIRFINANAANGFLPMPDDTVSADLIYLCSPNNPTGAVYDKAQLQAWVDYALRNHAVILFDAAYEAFLSDERLPHSIYEIDGAKGCAIEFCSFSKTAGFTGTRCGYTIVPHALVFDGMRLNQMWLRRQTTKCNGVSYIVQKGAEAVYTKEGLAQVKANIAYYRDNANRIMATLDQLGIWYTGGKHSPYLWLRCPHEMDAWSFFDALLTKTGIVGTPGAGFGANGKHYFRLTAFSSHEATAKAMERFSACAL